MIELVGLTDDVTFNDTHSIFGNLNNGHLELTDTNTPSVFNPRFLRGPSPALMFSPEQRPSLRRTGERRDQPRWGARQGGP